jgi:uncharacterized protein YecE (DUF72 family)
MIHFGTCSWNYDSWVDIVYNHKVQTAALYLEQYSKVFGTVEIDSWFYRAPSRKDVLEYKKHVPETFTFTCKVPQNITLTHFRQKSKSDPLVPNPDFFSVEQFKHFLDVIEPLADQIAVIMFEFEYLNKEKMASLEIFIERVGEFVTKIPKGIPFGLEPRNANYMKQKYFDFVKDNSIVHVFSEKLYMPHIYELYNQFKSAITSPVVIRLLGGDRAEIEHKTNEQWNKLVDEKKDIDNVVSMLKVLQQTDTEVYMNVNNHYEGSAPLTIRKMKSMLGGANVV